MDQFLTPLFAIFQWQNLLLMILGTLIGVVVGVLRRGRPDVMQ